MLDTFTQSLRDNPRLRWGVALIVGLFWLYGVLLLQEDLDERSRQRRTAAQTNARLQAQSEQPEWTTRLAPAKALAVQLESQLWQAPTPGLAQAAFQDWLNASLQQLGVSKLQVTVTVLQDAPAAGPAASAPPTTGAEPASPPGPAATPEDLWKIRAKLSFEAPQPVLLAALSRIETHDRKITVSALAVRTEQWPVPRIEMELIGYFQKQGAATPNANAAAPTAEPRPTPLSAPVAPPGPARTATP